MTLTQIQYFLEVCRTMNFTKAAQNLFVAQPSFSRQIQLLETELEVQLLNRSNRKVELTEAGEVFRDEFSRIVINIEGAIYKVQEAGKHKKEIRIGLFFGLNQNVVSDFVRKLKLYFEDYKVYVDKYSTYNLKKAFEMGNIDLLITVEGASVNVDECNFHEIRQLLPRIIYSLDCFPAGYVPDVPEDFQGMRCVYVNDGEAQELIRKQMEMAQRLGMKNIESDSVANVVSTLMFTDPKGSYSIYFNEVPERGLVAMPLDEDIGKFSISVYWKKDCRLPMKRFFENIYDDLDDRKSE